MKSIPLTNGGVALVDDKDYHRLAAHPWYRHPKGHAQRAQNVGKRVTTIYMHREILQAPAGTQVDHWDRNKLNNRRSNLRLATNGQNQWNRKKSAPASSKYKGVTFRPKHNPNKPWLARISINKKRIQLGYFAFEINAAEAYNRAAKKYCGQFARLNEVMA